MSISRTSVYSCYVRSSNNQKTGTHNKVNKQHEQQADRRRIGVTDISCKLSRLEIGRLCGFSSTSRLTMASPVVLACGNL